MLDGEKAGNGDRDCWDMALDVDAGFFAVDIGCDLLIDDGGERDCRGERSPPLVTESLRKGVVCVCAEVDRLGDRERRDRGGGGEDVRDVARGERDLRDLKAESGAWTLA